MIKTVDMLKEELNDYKNPIDKISRLSKQNKIFKLKNGLYETCKETPGHCLAQVLYDPSYLSFDFALYFHGLIPEAVVTYTSATYNKKKKKQYKNYFGNYLYRDVSRNVYHYGISLISQDDYNIQIATKEKALCDKLSTYPPCKNIEQVKTLILTDLRIDLLELSLLNIRDVEFLSNLYNSTNVILFLSF